MTLRASYGEIEDGDHADDGGVLDQRDGGGRSSAGRMRRSACGRITRRIVA